MATEDVDPGREPGAAVKRFRVVVIEGEDLGAIASSTGARLAIGSHDSCDLRLSDATVSRFHCEVVASGDRALLRDSGSRNGTSVDGVDVVEAYLKNGAVIAMGRTRIRYEVAGDVVLLPASERERFGTVVGRSIKMRQVFALLERAAASDATLLLEGETGTGKEVVAESVHLESARREQPFVVVDCGAVPRDLLESELFGHERGAFTGAVAARVGAFEAAGGGTLFLDEIGELAPELQPKLLRALERREVKPVGGSEYRHVDVRVIAATNRNLRREVNAARFRSDLYYRLAVIEVVLPPLRERRDDLPLLVESFLDALRAGDRPEAALVRHADFLTELKRHSWPGNVRELRNYVERCLAMRQAPPLRDPEEPDVPISIDLAEPLKPARDRLIAAFERAYLGAAIEQHGGNITQAARTAGVDRIHLYRMLRRLGLRS